MKKSFLSEINAIQILLKGGKSAKLHFLKWTQRIRDTIVSIQTLTVLASIDSGYLGRFTKPFVPVFIRIDDKHTENAVFLHFNESEYLRKDLKLGFSLVWRILQFLFV